MVIKEIMFQDLYSILAIVVIIGVLFFYFFVKKREEKDWVYTIYFIVTLFAGTVLYSFALVYNNDADTVFSPFFVVLRSLSFSLLSFAFNFNSSVFSSLAAVNQFFQAAVIIHFLAAIFLTILVFVKLFGRNLINSIRVNLISRGKKYIVIGCDGQAGIFIKNLPRKQKRHTIVIIEPAQADKKNELIYEGYAVVTIKEEKTDNKNIYGALHYALKKSGAMRCKYETKVISMSEQDETNLTVARIMTDYIVSLVRPAKKNGRFSLTDDQEKKLSEIKLDAYIMYSILERAEHFSFIENALGKARFFNPHKIRAYKFLWENPITKLIPSNWIDTETARLKTYCKDGRNRYKIGNIFVGFGFTNKAILKSNIVNNQLLNVDYNALIISQDAARQEMLFRNSAIGLFDKTENDKIIKRGAEIKPNTEGKAYLESPAERNILVFKEADALSIELYDLIIAEIEGSPAQNGKPAVPPCDYATIIIALGNNKLSIETALELRQKLYEADLLFGKDDKEYQRVRIFVKIDEATIHTDEMILNGAADEIKCRIETFGADEEILTEKYLIHEKLDVLAKNIANRYEGNAKTASAVNEWNTCTQLQRESNRYAAMAIPVKLNLLGLDLIKGDQTNNDYVDAFHKNYGTNAAIDLRAERNKLEKVIESARNVEKNSKTIPDNILSLKIKDDIIDLVERDSEGFADTPRNNLAMLEHQRWNAFYLANDWTKLPKEKIGAGRYGRQNIAAKQHACITTFSGLMELRELQKNAEKAEIEESKEKQYIEAESLLKADTIRHDFNTMDFLTSILAGSGYYIGKFEE